MSAIYQSGDGLRPSSLSLIAIILADADTIEISEGADRVVMYSWDDDRRTWRTASGQRISATALYAVIDVARKAKSLTVVAWNDGRRLV